MRKFSFTAKISLFIYLLLIVIPLSVSSCCNNDKTPQLTGSSADTLPSGYIKVADNISYDVIIKPEADSDPWEFEKLEGLQDSVIVNYLFRDVYDGKAKAVDFFTGEPVSIKNLRSLEQEFGNDRSKIAKLQFTEDWFLNSVTGEISKKIRSVTAGYEITDYDGRRMGYKAAFKIVYQTD